MKNIQLKTSVKLLKLIIFMSLLSSVQARSPAVLPVRGLDIPDANKKYLNGPPDLSKTSYRFDRGTPKVLVLANTGNKYATGANEAQISLIIALAGAFSLISPFLYFAFFKRTEKTSLKTISTPELNTNPNEHLNNVSQIPKRAAAMKEKSKIRKVS